MKTKNQKTSDHYELMEKILEQAFKRIQRVQEIPITLLLSENNAAKLLGLSKATLARWRILGRDPEFHDLEGSIRYNYMDILDFIEARKRRSTSQTTKKERK